MGRHAKSLAHASGVNRAWAIALAVMLALSCVSVTGLAYAAGKDGGAETEAAEAQGQATTNPAQGEGQTDEPGNQLSSLAVSEASTETPAPPTNVPEATENAPSASDVTALSESDAEDDQDPELGLQLRTQDTSAVVEVEDVVDRTSAIYAGNIIVDSESQLQYLYSSDITVTATVFEELQKNLADEFKGLVPSISSGDIAVHGFFRYSGSAQSGTQYKADTNYFGGISEGWSSAAAVAKRCFLEAAGAETTGSAAFDSTLSVSAGGSSWEPRNGVKVRVDTMILHKEKTTIVYTTYTATTCSHSNGVSVAEVPATCTADGVRAHWKCSGCGKLFTDETHATETTLDALKIAALGHDWGEWTEAGGKATRTCKRDATHTETVEIAYAAVSVDGAAWTKGSSDPLTFTFKRNVNDGKTYQAFKGARVDGIDVPESAIATAEGSLILSLTTTYFETLSVGEHKLTIAFEDGEATAAFTVKAAETKAAAAASSSPKSPRPVTRRPSLCS